jgi:NAD+ synthase (glutamine-hydrolysing)
MIRIALFQFNPTIGAIQSNAARIAQKMTELSGQIDLLITPEFSLWGYPSFDLLSNQRLRALEQNEITRLQNLTKDLNTGLLLGHGSFLNSDHSGPFLNSASLFDSGHCIGKIHKTRLPNYDIFEDARHFFAGPQEQNRCLEFRGVPIEIRICEDDWDVILAHGARDTRRYLDIPVNPKARLHINLSASPYTRKKQHLRQDLFQARATREQIPLVLVNSVGGQDDLIFDGGSFAMSSEGTLLAQAPFFEENTLLLNFKDDRILSSGSQPLPISELESIKKALVLGLRDFLKKSKTNKALIGLSGGVDSALVACLAVDALGPNNVIGVSLPSKITSSLSQTEATSLAKNLGIQIRTIPIQTIVDESSLLLGIQSGIPHENLQSRSRGLILNTLANAEGAVVLATGNKSELAMGYATLYGDLAGAILPIGDLYKTDVYQLARTYSAIPLQTLERPPTAELREGQQDSDSLPDYAILDGLLKELIENCDETIFPETKWDQILAPKFSVKEIRQKLWRQEFKRRQAPPILKVCARSFGQGWRVPVVKDIE